MLPLEFYCISGELGSGLVQIFGYGSKGHRWLGRLRVSQKYLLVFWGFWRPPNTKKFGIFVHTNTKFHNTQ